MSKRADHWIIKIGFWYLKHPRGEWTKKVDEAYGYHYKGGGKDPSKSGAEDEAKGWRDYCAMRRSDPPGMLPHGAILRGANEFRAVQVMRRDSGPDLLP